jgi:hypothetical protein
MLMLGALVSLFAGCAGTQSGNAEVPKSTAVMLGQANPQPAGSPTFRPGMNPQDPRDPHFTTRPLPLQSPPSAP